MKEVVTGKERRKKSKVMMKMVIGDVTMVKKLQGGVLHHVQTMS